MTVHARVMMATVVVLVVGGLATLLPLVAGSPEPREIVVVARQMAFYVGDGVTAKSHHSRSAGRADTRHALSVRTRDSIMISQCLRGGSTAPCCTEKVETPL